MHRRALLSLLAACLMPAPLAAQEAGLTAAEIEAMLRGNTAVGVWAGTPYRQWFAEDGDTIYAPKGQRSTRGKWRVNAEADLYESWWSGDLWEAYGVVRDGDVLYWTDPAGERHAFEMVEGQQLVWED